MPQKPSPSQYPALTGQFMVDAPRGGVRVRRWPKKRGKPKSEAQAKQVEWFRQASWWMKYLPAEFIQQAELLSHGTPLLTRDILMMAMAGRLYSFNLPGGKRWHPMAFITDVSKSLDALGIAPGSVLTRGQDLWQALQAPQSQLSALFGTGDGNIEWRGIATLSGPYKTLVRRTSNLSINAYAAIEWQIAEYDEAGLWSAAHPERITIPTDGIVKATFSYFFTSPSAGAPGYDISNISGGTVLGGSNPSGKSADLATTAWIPVSAGDYFSVNMFTGSASTLNAAISYLAAEFQPTP